MPSPIGHALAGLAAGWLIAPPATDGGFTRRATMEAVLFATAGMAADVDLLFGSHSGPTHGLGAAVIAGAMTVLVASAVSRTITTRTTVGVGRLGLAVIAAYATHTLLDWLGTDSSPPIGIMALWPLSREYHESPLHVFMAISRRYWLAEFWRHNLAALARELLILVPIAAITWRLRVAR